jgi:hypothetical protein
VVVAPADSVPVTVVEPEIVPPALSYFPARAAVSPVTSVWPMGSVAIDVSSSCVTHAKPGICGATSAVNSSTRASATRWVVPLILRSAPAVNLAI